MTRYALLFTLFFPLAACAQSTAVSHANEHVPVAVTEALTCAKPDLVGQNASVLETMEFKNPIRILGPHTAATMDFSPMRTNFITDAKGIILEIRCG